MGKQFWEVGTVAFAGQACDNFEEGQTSFNYGPYGRLNGFYFLMKGLIILVKVLAKDGTPLQPTNRHGKVRRLLDNNRAEVAGKDPFTIRLLYEVESKKLKQ